MPELPEVETVVRSLRATILHHLIVSATCWPTLSLVAHSEPLEALVGHRILDITRRGKLILLRTSAHPSTEDLYALVHLGMSGALLVQSPHAIPEPHCKFRLDLVDPNHQSRTLVCTDIRGFGKVYVSVASHLSSWDFFKHLGPEPLTLPFEEFQRIVQRKPAKRLKALLLDQTVLAGLGNIYTDESLFSAQLHPCRTAGSLSGQELKRLYTAIQTILVRSIEQCGTSFRNYRDAHGHAGAFQNYLAVYGKALRPCPRCGKLLQKLTVAGRGTVVCPHCQPLAPPAAP